MKIENACLILSIVFLFSVFGFAVISLRGTTQGMYETFTAKVTKVFPGVPSAEYIVVMFDTHHPMQWQKEFAEVFKVGHTYAIDTGRGTIIEVG